VYLARVRRLNRSRVGTWYRRRSAGRLRALLATLDHVGHELHHHRAGTTLERREVRRIVARLERLAAALDEPLPELAEPPEPPDPTAGVLDLDELFPVRRR